MCIRDSTYIVPTTNNEITQPSQPAFFATLQAAADNVTGDGTLYILGDTDVGATLVEIFDQNADLNPGSSAGAIFTAPVTGRYFLTTNINVSDLEEDNNIQSITIHTSNRYHIAPLNAPGITRDSSDQYGNTLAVLADMDAADTAVVEIEFSNTAKAVDMISHASSNFCSFAGYLVI